MKSLQNFLAGAGVLTTGAGVLTAGAGVLTACRTGTPEREKGQGGRLC